MVDKTANVKNVFKSIYRNNETMEKTTPSTLNTWKVCGPDPPENCQLNVKKFAKNLTFFQKNANNFYFFQKNCQWQFFEKNENFGNFFGKNVKFLSIFWHSNGNFQESQLVTDLQSRNHTRHELTQVQCELKPVYWSFSAKFLKQIIFVIKNKSEK